MIDITKFRVKKDRLVKVGDRVQIEDIEWKVAEIVDNSITLYREGIGGTSYTIQKSEKEVENLLSQHD
ncbi:MAG: hypothetical protein HOB40_00155 [Candidatus Marinimicrobia bacterium]|jgi:hypothetical protein|nr:hypothetical protein [Candidatus Neomarinimicrobiota bacterium]MBT3502588.1 hypothetical protein [Candidatus Neomarinimicrobiota bacterium]MBT3839242.1 hypothetical protein [Candidatus Neomarinimicrobiota bacterium]MBT3999203.1 hypothetical protein [Candidatus Neomarinimicrobiota bacterium]MBT4281903.1 hypothetical protein [Candidatus Neomarinimicrobiota bacterium]